MTTVEIFSNDKCLPIPNMVIPFDVHANYHRTVARAVDHAKSEPTFMSSNIAIIPLSGDERLVVSA
ncbi:hypothetical protein [Thaumasiovibrio sp. DFM-14]|uniref:hypothetical protein n=1 Tax=Thaumasiovibrio sp. DFM-14 TaxID=3384792 RepID=UPI0039A1477D